MALDFGENRDGGQVLAGTVVAAGANGNGCGEWPWGMAVRSGRGLGTLLCQITVDMGDDGLLNKRAVSSASKTPVDLPQSLEFFESPKQAPSRLLQNLSSILFMPTTLRISMDMALHPAWGLFSWCLSGSGNQVKYSSNNWLAVMSSRAWQSNAMPLN